MQGKFSKKQIGVLSVVALMAMPASVMASEELQTQQEETVAAHEVETELSDLMESVTEPESVQTESLPESFSIPFVCPFQKIILYQGGLPLISVSSHEPCGACPAGSGGH